MKTMLSIAAAVAALCFASGCVNVHHDEPAATRTTTVTAPVPAASVSSTTTTY